MAFDSREGERDARVHTCPHLDPSNSHQFNLLSRLCKNNEKNLHVICGADDTNGCFAVPWIRNGRISTRRTECVQIKEQKRSIFQQIAGINRYVEKDGKWQAKAILNRSTHFWDFLGVSRPRFVFNVCACKWWITEWFFLHSFSFRYLLVYLRISLHDACSYYIHNIISFVRKRIVYITRIYTLSDS